MSDKALIEKISFSPSVKRRERVTALMMVSENASVRNAPKIFLRHLCYAHVSNGKMVAQGPKKKLKRGGKIDDGSDGIGNEILGTTRETVISVRKRKYH